MFGLAPTTISTAPSTPSAAAPRALIERQMAKLERLSEIGMEIAEAAGRRACALADGDAPDDAAAAEPALSFSRAARAVRLTIALQSRLVEALAALERGEAVARISEASRRRNRIQRLVEEAAEAEGCDTEEVERLSSEAWERLSDEDDDDLLGGPIQQVVARICKDLGLPPDWSGWSALWPSPAGEAEPRPLGPAAPARLGADAVEVPERRWSGAGAPPGAVAYANSRLQREQSENTNEPGTQVSERVRE